VGRIRVGGRRPHGPVGAADADVDVQGERVVALGHPLQALGHPAVVVGLDELLLAVVAERVGAGGAEDQVALAARATRRRRWSCCLASASARSSPRPERISISDLMSSPEIDAARTDRRLGGVAQLLEARGRARASADRRSPSSSSRADGGVDGGLERLAGGIEVDAHVR
jgi:hypothetical protein